MEDNEVNMDQGNKIQAFFEELGRWEPAKVREKLEDGTLLESFPGWGKEHIAIIEGHRLRRAVHSFQSEVGKKNTRLA